MQRVYKLGILTHHKCATNWIRAICYEMQDIGLINPITVGGDGKSERSLVFPDAPYVLINVNASKHSLQGFEIAEQPVRHFVRDPRDALVSNYWSWRKSHVNNNERIVKFRDMANKASVEDGLMEMIKYFPMGRQLSTWSDKIWSEVVQVRYEDALEDFDRFLKETFHVSGIKISSSDAEVIRENTSFSKMSKGRARGVEDTNSHFRKGVSGDWKTYFTNNVESEFMRNYEWLGERLHYW